MAKGGTCQDADRNRLSEARSRSRDGRGGDLSGQIKKPTDQAQGTLTSWRPQSESLVRTRKETDRSRHTHQLETAEGETCQDTERNRPSRAHSQTRDSRGTFQATERNRLSGGHSRPRDGRARDLSGHRKKPTEQDALTNWGQQRERLVRTQKKTDRPRRTHILETAEGENCQDTERNQLSEAHPQTEDGRGRDLSERGKRPTEVHSRSRDGRGRDLSGHRKKPTERGALTDWRRQRERFVRIRKETDRSRHTHKLKTTEGGICQDMERN